ncbi:unnamed protein product [Dibothriocephalus latus]|uniref:Uncharacterized protein n=1 Tax=Dibothriocephalus latus TaxID=60516 RepID=A0A3P7NNC9_DIBLA|nr:unnamed protein product [Dibothriocephalus latus]
MANNLLENLLAQLSQVSLQSSRLTLSCDYPRWEARMRDYLEGVDEASQTRTILAQLEDDVYDLARAAGASSTQSVEDLFKTLSGVLRQANPSWILISEFRQQLQGPLESVLQYQEALRLLGKQAYPQLDLNSLNYMVMEQFVNGLSDPEVRKAYPRLAHPGKCDGTS